jgi:DNA-binding LytR/AlgR family response regulator
MVIPRREVVSMNLGAVQEILPSHFIRISRSIIINSDYLIKVSGTNKRCVLKAGNEEIEFSIPEKQLPELRKALENL